MNDEQLKAAELEKTRAEIDLLHSNREKIEMEKQALAGKDKQKWWNIKASGLIQALIAGIVAGALVAGFMLDHFLKVAELNEKVQQALIAEKEEVLKRADELEKKEEESRQIITSLRHENQKLKKRIESSLKELAALSDGRDRPEGGIKIETKIDSLKEELNRLKQQTVSREASLDTELRNLVEKRGQASAGHTNNWFAVIASAYNKHDLIGKLEELDKRAGLRYPVHAYKTSDKRGNPVYAITLDGYLSKAEAAERVAYAIETGIAKDAYPWSSEHWGKNIAKEVANRF